MGAAGGVGGAVEVEGGYGGVRGGEWKHGRLSIGTCVLFSWWAGCWASVVGRRALKTDHWFYGLFQSAPDLIALLLPAAGGAGASAVPSLGPDSPGDALYRFDAPELIAARLLRSSSGEPSP